ncbi:MAG TPA: hypothetical protein VEQ59_16825, partial [Polyangiaceae bacterium]|nr:hypothetical protein [Polyangiaceae bacterium]
MTLHTFKCAASLGALLIIATKPLLAEEVASIDPATTAPIGAAPQAAPAPAPVVDTRDTEPPARGLRTMDNTLSAFGVLG